TDEPADATQMADDYRLLAHGLGGVRRLMPGSRTREYLEAAYARAHATLYRGAWHPGYALLNLLRDEIPQVVSGLRFHILWASVIFVLTVLAGYWLVRSEERRVGKEGGSGWWAVGCVRSARWIKSG